MMINMEVNGRVLKIRLWANSSAAAVMALLKTAPLTIPMKDYAHMEKFGKLGMSLPRNDEYITTRAGDVILSEGNMLVIYYAPNTWNFTRLGRVQGITAEELKRILGKGSVSVTLSLGGE